jgi:cytochrome bd-type quinol oxidase subunit 2
MRGETVIESIKHGLLRLVEAMSPAGMHFVMEVSMLVIVPLVLTGCGYLLSVRTAVAQGTPQTAAPNRGVQISLFVIGVLAALCLPVNKVEIDEPAARLWICTIAVLIGAFGPALLGYLIVPDATAQRATVRNLYVVILALTAWQVIRESFL